MTRPTCRGTGLAPCPPTNCHASMVDLCPDCDGTGDDGTCPCGHTVLSTGGEPCMFCGGYVKGKE